MGDMSVSAGGSGGQVVLALTTSSAGVTIHPWHHLQPTAPQSTQAANYYQPLPFLSSPLPVKQNPRPSLIGVRAKSSARPKFCRASASPRGRRFREHLIQEGDRARVQDKREMIVDDLNVSSLGVWDKHFLSPR